MTVTCLLCHRIITRYAPADELRLGLCADCSLEQAERERAALSCGRGTCVLETVPYECLTAAAAGEGEHECPAEAPAAARSSV